jgi:hypothetical protein
MWVAGRWSALPSLDVAIRARVQVQNRVLGQVQGMEVSSMQEVGVKQ